MPIPNLVLDKKETKTERFWNTQFTDTEKELVERLNEAFPEDSELMELLDVIMRKYFKILGVPETGRCMCGRDLHISAYCNICDRDE